jgi:flagellar export protein FliJ
MKRFQFPLEPLRVLREQNERAAQQRHARALAACAAAEAQLQNAVKKLTEGLDLLTRELSAGASAGQIMNLRTWCLVLEIQKHERAAALMDARGIAENTFKAMLAAMRDREGLDLFRDKLRRAHDFEFRREEQKNFDEMAVQSGRADSLLEFAGHENLYPA